MTRPEKLLLFAGIAGIAGVVAAVAVFRASQTDDAPQEAFTGAPATDPGPVHVHGLGIDPSDGSLFVATHTGLFRLARNARKPARVGDRFQDTMGFSVVGPNRFLGSGHPDARDRLPPLLGLVESNDAGRTWQPVSLLGEADFHVLRATGKRVYGYDASNDRLLASADGGRSWQELTRPGPIADLAPDPADPLRLVVAAGGADAGLHLSPNAGRSWTRLSAAVGLLAWPAPARLYLVDGRGQVFASADGGRGLAERGTIGGEPAALLAHGDDLYVALHDGTIKRSSDGGATWVVRSRP